MQRLSTVVFNPDTTREAEDLMRRLRPLLNATDGDYLEMSITERPLLDDGGDEVTIHVTLHIVNIGERVDVLSGLGLI